MAGIQNKRISHLVNLKTCLDTNKSKYFQAHYYKYILFLVTLSLLLDSRTILEILILQKHYA